jgi:hypothetical protein
MSLGLNIDLIDPTTCINPTEPALKSRKTSSGSPLCSDKDGVHLTGNGYRELAGVIVEMAAGGGADYGDSRKEDAASCGTYASKRQQPDSVVTLPPAPPPKRGRSSTAPTVAGWLTGRADIGRHGVRGVRSCGLKPLDCCLPQLGRPMERPLGRRRSRQAVLAPGRAVVAT